VEQVLKEKIAYAITEKFVGNYIFSDDELSIIYDEAGKILRRIGCEWGEEVSLLDYDLIFVALVNLAKEWNLEEEDALFDFFYKKLLGNMSGWGKIYTQITKVIQGLFNSNKIFMLNSYKKKFYASLCAHSFAPIRSIQSFFYMCWEIYCIDLDETYEKNDPTFELITQSLYKKFTSFGYNEEDFQIGSKVYSIRSGVRGLAIDEPKLMTELLDTTMECINSLFNNEPIRIDNYIKFLINEWWKGNEDSFGIKGPLIPVKKERIATDYSQIKAKYVLENGIAKLVVPGIRLFDNFDYDPYIEIQVNGEKYKCERMETRGSGILMATKSLEYPLSEMSINNKIDISVEITHCSKTIYNSNNLLNREFILFKDTKEIISQDCLPGIYFMYVTDIDLLLQYPKDIHRNNINTYSFEPSEGEVLQSSNKTVFFISEKTKRDFYFFAKENNDVVYRLGDEEYRVIDGDLYVDVDASLNAKEYGVRYEDCYFKLIDFELENLIDRNRYKVSSLLRVGEAQHISIFKFGENTIISSINLIKFNNIRVSYEKELYYGKGEIGTASFVTEKYNVRKQFSVTSNEISIPLESGEIVLYPPILRWKIDDGDWKTQPLDSGLWYKDFTNSSILSLELPKTMSCIVALSNNDIVEQRGKNLDYKVGQTVYALRESDKYSSNKLTLFIKTNTNDIYHLADIYYRESFVAEPLYVFSNLYQILWTPENYIGDKDSRFRFDIIDDKKVIFSKLLITKKETIRIKDIKEGYYKYKITLLGREKDFLNKEKELCSKDFVFGDEHSFRYKNKVLTITSVMLFEKANPEKCRPVYIDCINYLGNRNNDYYYSGSIYIVNRDGIKIYLNTMKNDLDEYVKINPIRFELKSDNSCYIGYGLDLQDEDYEYDNEFSLDNQGKITACQKFLGVKTKGINFFLFEVRKNV